MKKDFQFPMVYIMRHSERCDLSFNPYQRAKIIKHYDSPITDYGHEIAYKTGQFYKSEMTRLVDEKLREPNFKFCIVSSPYQRCLETSNEIIKAIGIENIYQKKIFIEDAIEEKYINWFVPKDVKEKRFFPNNMNEEKRQELFSEITPVHNTLFDYENYFELTAQWNEQTLDGCKKRFSYACDNQIDRSMKDSGVAYIIVSHGVAMSALAKQVPQYAMPRYCAVNLIEKIGHDVDNYPLFNNIIFDHYAYKRPQFDQGLIFMVLLFVFWIPFCYLRSTSNFTKFLIQSLILSYISYVKIYRY